MSIKVFNTHIEVSPYTLGQLSDIEDKLSTWDPSHTMMLPCAYLVYDDTLFLPRGIDYFQIERSLKEKAEIVISDNIGKIMKRQHYPLLDPRDEDQHKVVRFITGRGSFDSTEKYHQLSVQAKPGFGKTFCTLYSITLLKRKAIVITHTDKLKHQWIKAAITDMDYDQDDCCDISGAGVLKAIMDGKLCDKELYFVNHQTLHSWLSTMGSERLKRVFDNIGVGIKVIDEAHIQFRNTLFLDYFTNVHKTIYLTATFDRSDKDESKIFKMAFQNAIVFGKSMQKISERHAHYNIIHINSRATMKDIYGMKSYAGYGIDLVKYGKYAFMGDKRETMYFTIVSILDKLKDVEGKIVIFCPLIDVVEMLKERLSKLYPNKLVGCMYSKISKSESEFNQNNSDFLITTVKSAGTGLDVKGLRVVINTEQYASKLLGEQHIGRLRPYFNKDGEQLDTYFFDIVDVSISMIVNYHKSRRKAIEPNAKKVNIIDMTVSEGSP